MISYLSNRKVFKESQFLNLEAPATADCEIRQGLNTHIEGLKRNAEALIFSKISHSNTISNQSNANLCPDSTLLINESEIYFEKEKSDGLKLIEQIFFDLDIKLKDLKEERKIVFNEKEQYKNNKEKYKELKKRYKEINKEIKKLMWNHIDFTDDKLKFLVDSYKSWLKKDVYLEFTDMETGEKIFRRGAKRGNSVYRRILNEKIKENADFIWRENKNKQFAINELLLNDRHTKTKTIFVTLTWDPNIFLGSRLRAWLSIDYFYNIFITKFRKKYGRCWVLRAIESTENGYPHLHLIIICENDFNVFEHNKRFRIKEKKDIEKMWNSFVDIEVPTDAYSLEKYILKDLLKGYNKKGNQRTNRDWLTLALCWIFRKQSYSISGFDANDLITECIIQTQFKEISNKYAERTLIFEGLVGISFFNKPPPNEFICKLSEDRLVELQECRIKTFGVIVKKRNYKCYSCGESHYSEDMVNIHYCKLCFNNSGARRKIKEFNEKWKKNNLNKN